MSQPDDGAVMPVGARPGAYGDVEAHRGQLIMILGILSLIIAGIILGPIAWIMGRNDLKAMDAGRMDPAGRDNTNVGRICGMIATLLHAGGLAVGFFCCFAYFGMMGAFVATASRQPTATSST